MEIELNMLVFFTSNIFLSNVQSEKNTIFNTTGFFINSFTIRRKRTCYLKLIVNETEVKAGHKDHVTQLYFVIVKRIMRTIKLLNLSVEFEIILSNICKFITSLLFNI